jgi:hypothetical protein
LAADSDPGRPGLVASLALDAPVASVESDAPAKATAATARLAVAHPHPRCRAAPIRLTTAAGRAAEPDPLMGNKAGSAAPATDKPAAARPLAEEQPDLHLGNTEELAILDLDVPVVGAKLLEVDPAILDPVVPVGAPEADIPVSRKISA